MYNDQFTTKAVDFLVGKFALSCYLSDDDSHTQLGLSFSPCFFAADMFNDEIDQVRLNAIHSLRKIGTRTKLVLDADQLEIVIGALEDADKTARESTHDLLRFVYCKFFFLMRRLIMQQAYGLQSLICSIVLFAYLHSSL